MKRLIVLTALLFCFSNSLLAEFPHFGSIEIGIQSIDTKIDIYTDYPPEQFADGIANFHFQGLIPDMSFSFFLFNIEKSPISVSKIRRFPVSIRVFASRFVATYQAIIKKPNSSSPDIEYIDLDLDTQIEVSQLSIHPTILIVLNHNTLKTLEIGVGGITYWAIEGNAYLTSGSDPQCIVAVAQIKASGNSADKTEALKSNCERKAVSEAHPSIVNIAPYAKFSIYNFYASAVIQTLSRNIFYSRESPILSDRYALGFSFSF